MPCENLKENIVGISYLTIHMHLMFHIQFQFSYKFRSFILRYCHLALSTLGYIRLVPLDPLMEPTNLMLLCSLSYVICLAVVHQLFPKKHVSLNNSDKIKDITQYILLVYYFYLKKFSGLGQP